MKRRFLATAWRASTGAVLALAIVAGCSKQESAPTPPAKAADAQRDAQRELVARGEYLAAAGDCVACHTVRGGQFFAGGLEIPTPFGVLYTPNITPDKQTGIGTWTADDFWRAMHDGRSKDGSFLYPAFPYTNYTKVTRADSDTIYAYFMSVPPINQKSKPHALGFPYNQRQLMAAWRALLQAGRVSGRPEAVEGVESRCVPGRRAGSLQRVPLHAQRARRDHRRRRLLRRPDPGAELVCTFADVEPRDRPRRLGDQGDRGPLAHRRGRS
jgi:mono/diheme cytochrome c family protein